MTIILNRCNKTI